MLPPPWRRVQTTHVPTPFPMTRSSSRRTHRRLLTSQTMSRTLTITAPKRNSTRNARAARMAPRWRSDRMRKTGAIAIAPITNSSLATSITRILMPLLSHHPSQSTSPRQPRSPQHASAIRPCACQSDSTLPIRRTHTLRSPACPGLCTLWWSSQRRGTPTP